ncbi:hypothetical protein H2248_004563 [Termitomyces sp. 'cryptogamus']|nr:hypothetical protein H2248_004563 [Termitomyces sp. 'cryptogamus']
MAEEAMYPTMEEAASNYIGHVSSYEDMRIKMETVDTNMFIHGNLKHLRSQPPLAGNSHKGHKHGADSFGKAEGWEARIFIEPVSDIIQFVFNTTKITACVLARTLLMDHGWPLQSFCFCDLPELGCVCKHIVKALEFLYFQKETLQRDISIGNVLISSINGAENTEGCLFALTMRR